MTTVLIDGLTSIQVIIESLNKACCPEDVFGNDPGKSYKQLARMCHPDVINHPLAEQTFQKLNTMKEEADKRVAAGKWGKRLPFTHCTPLEIGKYRVVRSPYVGDVADVYKAENEHIKLPRIIKVARHSDDNDLIRAEAEALEILQEIKSPVKDGVPRLLDSFTLDGGTRKRRVNVITRYPGFWTAQEVRSVMTSDGRTLVWMFKRIMSLLSWVHHLHLVHGAILPPHVMFYPDNDGNKDIDPRKHSLRLIDWCYSVNFQSRTRLSAWIPAWKDLYAPELLDKSYIGPESDIYMAAQLMLYLCGTPRMFPPELDVILVKCLQKDPKKRYKKAGEVLNEWKEAALKAYGAPKWHEFNLPTTPSGR